MHSGKYDAASDEELVLWYRQGEKSAADFIINKYKNLVLKKAGSMFLLGGDRDDLIQEGMLGMFKAVRDYDLGKHVNFFSFADLCISRQMYTAVQSSNRKKHLPLNTYVSIYSQSLLEDEESREGGFLFNILATESEKSPEDMVIEQESIQQMEASIAQQLSKFETEVLNLYLAGFNYTEIAGVLGKHEKATDNALQRIKTKVRKIVREKS